MRALKTVLAVFILSPALAIAHVGHKKETAPVKEPAMEHSMDHATPTKEPAGDSFYGGAESSESASGNMYGMSGGEAPSLSGSNLMDEDIVPMNTPMAGMKGMEGSHSEQSGADKHEQHVEPAEHSRVDSSSKGYGAAIGITALSGLLFVAMCAIKPFE